MTSDESAGEGLKALDVLIGTWNMEAIFPDRPAEVVQGGRSVFEWMKGHRLLVQRTEMPAANVPDSISVVAAVGEESYIQHYFDSRGVVRLYEMTLGDGLWTLLRTAPDFSPLDFSQRFVGRLNDSLDTIQGYWEKSLDGDQWQKDFDLIYRRLVG